MDINFIQLNRQIAFLNHKHLEELQLFVEFLLNKQQKQVQPIPNSEKKPMLLADIEAIPMPVSDHIIQRDEIYSDRIQG